MTFLREESVKAWRFSPVFELPCLLIESLECPELFLSSESRVLHR